MTLFTKPQGEILNDGSACDVVNIRKDFFPQSWNFWLILFLAEIYM